MIKKLDFSCVGRHDSSGNEYFFSRLHIPFFDIVVFIHPWEKENGEFGCEVVIKEYTGPNKEKRFNDKNDNNRDGKNVG